MKLNFTGQKQVGVVRSSYASMVLNNIWSVCVLVAGFLEVGLVLLHGATPVYAPADVDIVLYESSTQVATFNVQNDCSPGGGTAGVVRFFFLDFSSNDIPVPPFGLATVRNSNA